MATMFACPSPKGTNNAQLFLTRAGRLVDRRGNDWGASSIRRMARDEALTPAFGAERAWTPMDHQAARTRHDLEEALKTACEAHGLDDGEHKELLDLIHGHLKGEAQEGRGMGATDRGKGALDDDAVEERVRKLLADKGLDEETIEEALKRVRADREAARDSRPQNAVHGGFGGRLSDASKDEEAFEREFPDSKYTSRDVYGSPASENFDPDVDRPGYNPKVYRAGLHAAEELSGGGVSRRLSNDAALEASDEEMEALYPGISNVRAGAF
jgi:hypothetical protein